MELQEAIGNLIKRLRKENNISQEQLALEGGFDRKYMSDVENGKRNISLDILVRIAKYFRLSVSDMLFIAEQLNTPKHTLKEVKDALCEKGCADSVVFENPDYLSAIEGISEDDRVIYSYNKMVQWLINHEGMKEDEAIEFVNYNTIRSLSDFGKKAPIIIHDFEI